MTGHCRFCGCTYERACPQGCAWTDNRRTVCTACVVVAAAWNSLSGSHPPPNMTRAFARGFFVATEDVRAVGEPGVGTNPYASSGASARYWQRGWTSGITARELAQLRAVNAALAAAFPLER